MTSKKIKIVLAASLAVNLLLIGGGVATFACRHGHKHPHPHMRKGPEMHRMHKKGMQDHRPDQRVHMEKDGNKFEKRRDFQKKPLDGRMHDTPEMQKFREEMQENRANLEKALRMEPFNEAEVRKAIEEIHDMREGAFEKRTDKMIEEAKKLSPEERVRLFSPKRHDRMDRPVKKEKR